MPAKHGHVATTYSDMGLFRRGWKENTATWEPRLPEGLLAIMARSNAPRSTSARPAYCPPLVISVHGIRTAGRWQKSLADTLGSHKIEHRNRDYGNFGLFRFAWGPSRQHQVDDFYEFYSATAREKGLNIDLDDYRSRPSIIAHSFGSYIIGYAMKKYPDIRFDKIILCGAILPVDFDWSTLFHRDQVNFVRNEYGAKDRWAASVRALVGDAGASGQKGFQFLSTVVSQERFESFGHSDYFHRAHIESHWIPILVREPSPLQIQHGRNMGPDISKFVAILNAVAAIDDTCFSHLPNYTKLQIPRGLSTTWIEINPDIYTFLLDRDRNRVCGYINAVPVQDKCFERIKAGKLKDNELRADDIKPFLQNQTLKLYLMSIAIDPVIRNASQGLYQEPFERLMSGLINKLYHYAVNCGIRVTELVAVGWTGAGTKLCMELGMQIVGEDSDGHPIYWVDLTSNEQRSVERILPGVQRLLDAYRYLIESTEA
jgi:pimeloyl-ACP methyl ester carboxylesterase